MSVSPVPSGFHTVTAQLSIDGAEKAIDFYQKALGAEVVSKAIDPSGKRIWHASLRIGDAMVFVNDVFPEMGGTQSQSSLWLYVNDCDASYKRAVDAGAKSTMEVSDMFWGDRMGQVTDPFGQKWTIATRKKDLTPDQLKAAEKEFIAKMAAQKKS